MSPTCTALSRWGIHVEDHPATVGTVVRQRLATMIQHRLVTAVLVMTVNVSPAVYIQSMPVNWAARHVMPAATAPPGIRPGLYAISFATRTIGCAGGVRRITCTTNAGHRWVQRYLG